MQQEEPDYNDAEGPMSLTIDTRKQFFDENEDFAKQEEIASAAGKNEAFEKITEGMTEQIERNSLGIFSEEKYLRASVGNETNDLIE